MSLFGALLAPLLAVATALAVIVLFRKANLDWLHNLVEDILATPVGTLLQQKWATFVQTASAILDNLAVRLVLLSVLLYFLGSFGRFVVVTGLVMIVLFRKANRKQQDAFRRCCLSTCLLCTLALATILALLIGLGFFLWGSDQTSNGRRYITQLSMDLNAEWTAVPMEDRDWVYNGKLLLEFLLFQAPLLMLDPDDIVAAWDLPFNLAGGNNVARDGSVYVFDYDIIKNELHKEVSTRGEFVFGKPMPPACMTPDQPILQDGGPGTFHDEVLAFFIKYYPPIATSLDSPVKFDGEWDPDSGVSREDTLKKDIFTALWRELFGLTEVKTEILDAMGDVYDGVSQLCAMGKLFHEMFPAILTPLQKGHAFLLEEIKKSPLGGDFLRKQVEKAVRLGELRNFSAIPDSEKYPCQIGETTYDIIARQALTYVGFAGAVGCFPYSKLLIDRIESNPKVYKPMWDEDWVAFMHEQARVQPLAPAVTPVAQEDWTMNVSTPSTFSTKEVTITKGQPWMALISTANVDPRVFGGIAQSNIKAQSFDPKRAEMDEMLSWGGRLGDVKEFTAPRGCPGYRLSMRIGRAAAEKYMPNTHAHASIPKTATGRRSQPNICRGDDADTTDCTFYDQSATEAGSFVLDGKEANYMEPMTDLDRLGLVVWLVACLSSLGAAMARCADKCGQDPENDDEKEEEEEEEKEEQEEQEEEEADDTPNDVVAPVGAATAGDSLGARVCFTYWHPLVRQIAHGTRAMGAVTQHLMAFLLAQSAVVLAQLAENQLMYNLALLWSAVPPALMVITVLSNFGFRSGKSSQDEETTRGYGCCWCARMSFGKDYLACLCNLWRRLLCGCCWCACDNTKPDSEHDTASLYKHALVVDSPTVVGHFFSCCVWIIHFFLSLVILAFWYLHGATQNAHLPATFLLRVGTTGAVLAVGVFMLERRWRPKRRKPVKFMCLVFSRGELVALGLMASVTCAAAWAYISVMVSPSLFLFTSRLIFAACLPFIFILANEMDDAFPYPEVVVPNLRRPQFAIYATVATALVVVVYLTSWINSSPIALATWQGDVCMYHRRYIKQFNRSAMSSFDESLCTSTELSQLDDAYSRAVFVATKSLTAVPPSEIAKVQNPDLIQPPIFEQHIGRREIFPGADWYVPTDDEDVDESGAIEMLSTMQFMFQSVLGNEFLFPMSSTDGHMAWDDLDKATRALELAVGEYVPLPNTDWTDIALDSAAAITRITFQGICSLRLEMADDDDEATFKADFSDGANYDVRPGYAHYGATAYFNEHRELIKITRATTGQTFYPNDPQWRHMMHLYKVTCFVMITVKEHLAFEHLVNANLFATYMREELGRTHPLRLFFKPYLYRTPSINIGSTFLLTPQHGLLHRASAFEWETGMKPALKDSIHAMRMKENPMEQWQPVLDHFGEDAWREFPFGHDGAAFFKVMQAHVRRYVEVYYGEANTKWDLSTDLALRSFWHRLEEAAPFLGLPPFGELTVESLSNYLAFIAFHVTGMHNVVGNVAEYLSNPRFTGVRVRPGEEVSDVQGSFYGSIVSSLVGLNSTKLMHPFLQLLRQDEHVEETTAVMHQFMTDLEDLDRRVEEWNKGRVSFWGFHPSNLLSSVAI